MGNCSQQRKPNFLSGRGSRGKEITFNQARHEWPSGSPGGPVAHMLSALVGVVKGNQGLQNTMVYEHRGGSSLWPILDLHVLKRYLRKYTFRMLTYRVLCRLIRLNEWFLTIDLADVYFHAATYPTLIRLQVSENPVWLVLFQLGKVVMFRLCIRLLGLMASEKAFKVGLHAMIFGV